MFDPFVFVVILVILLMITVLVAAHEYGHYLFARLFGMDVEEFAIGMGRPKWVWMRRGDTEFTFRAFPIGGFVRIKGMLPEEDGSEVLIENGFYSKSPLARFMVLLAGPVFSVLAGFILLLAVFTAVGREQANPKPVIGSIIPKSVASMAGLKAKDVVVSIDGKPMSTWFDMVSYVRDRPNKLLEFKINRAGEFRNFGIRPFLSTEPVDVYNEKGEPTGVKRRLGQIGVSPDYEMERLSVGEALKEAAMMPVAGAVGYFETFTHPKDLQKNLSGPGTIVEAASDSTRAGPYRVIVFAALLSISVGFLNLLPFPPLDGGQMAVAVAEMLRRGRRLSIRMQGIVNGLGFAVVLALVFSACVFDAKRLTTKEPQVGVPTGLYGAGR